MDGPSPVLPGDVLAQPTRARLFARLEQLRRPASTAELAEFVALHPNGVRSHLERMEEAELVERRRLRRGRGRPLDTWVIAAGARPGGRAPEGYQELGRWLARALASPRRGVAGIEATGREIGRELAPEDARDPELAFETAFSALGFQPRLERESEPERLTICLGNCPYRDAVRENQTAICALHKGITVGLLERIAPRARVREFAPRDPYRAGCTIQVSAWPQASAGQSQAAGGTSG